MTQLILAIFFVRGYFPLIQKDSSTHMHSVSVYIKEGLPSFSSIDALLRLCAWFLILFHLT